MIRAFTSILLLLAPLPAAESVGSLTDGGETLRDVPFQSRIKHVQPMTGIVFWEDSGRNETDAIQLEYSYMRYDDIVSRKGEYDWAPVEKKLKAIATRKHQAILRFHFVYYNKRDQKLALAPNGPNGVSFEAAARDFHISYMIGNDQPQYQPLTRIREAGLACGYKFRVTRFQSGDGQARVTIANVGIAPIYHDAFAAVNGVRASKSLKGLDPGESSTFDILSGGKSPHFTIESDRLVPGQSIEVEADL